MPLKWGQLRMSSNDWKAEPSIVMPGEKVLWQSKPERGPFILSGVGGGSIFGLFFLGFAIFWVLTAAGAGAPVEFWSFGMIFVFIGLFLVFGIPITQLLRYRNTLYTITDNRIITQTGIIGLDTRFIEFEWIRDIYVNVGVIDRIFGTGSLFLSTASGMVYTGSNLPTMLSLRDPYEVQRLVQKILDEHQEKQGQTRQP